jgi:hypothetical protein
MGRSKMEIRLEARTVEPSLLTGREEMPLDAEIAIGDGVRLRHLGTDRYMDGAIPSLVVFALTAAAGVGTGMVSSALWDYLKLLVKRLQERSRAGGESPSPTTTRARARPIKLRLVEVQAEVGPIRRNVRELSLDIGPDTDVEPLRPLIVDFLIGAGASVHGSTPDADAP